MNCSLLTYNLVQLGDDEQPVGFASGCAIKYRNALFLLTVSHATGNQGKWAVELEYDKIVGMQKLWKLGAMSFVTKGKLKGNSVELDELDFSHKILDQELPAFYEELDVHGNAKVKIPKKIIETDFSSPIDPAEAFSFWGLTKHRYNSIQLLVEPRMASNLQFVREEGDYLFFRTPIPYTSYNYYQGCSGAPIVDKKGCLVALVVEGDDAMTGILGLNLSKLRSVLDVEIAQR